MAVGGLRSGRTSYSGTPTKAKKITQMEYFVILIFSGAARRTTTDSPGVNYTQPSPLKSLFVQTAFVVYTRVARLFSECRQGLTLRLYKQPLARVVLHI